MEGPISAPSPEHALAVATVARALKRDDPDRIMKLTRRGALQRVSREYFGAKEIVRERGGLLWRNVNLFAAVATSPAKATALYLKHVEGDKE